MKAGGRLVNCGCTGDMAMALCKAESEVELAFTFALGMGRRHVVSLVGDSLRVVWCELDMGRECAD